MISVFLIVLLAAGFFIIGFMLKKYPDEERTKKATGPLSLLIDLSPLIGVIVFSILFACVLKGRLLERVTHAVLVFGIWMCATKFYCYILAHFKKKRVLISCIIGMLYSIGLAVFLTPLDRYVEVLYSFTGWYSILLGCGLLAVFYAIVIITAISKGYLKNKRQK